MATVSQTNETRSSEEDPDLLAMEMCTSWIFSAALRTIVQLDVPSILAVHATPPLAAMTAEELLQHMQTEGMSPSPRNLERLLRLLTTKGVFAEHLSGDDNARRFSLTRLSRCFVRGSSATPEVALFLTLGPEYAATLENLRDSVLNSKAPFTVAHGMNQFEYMKTHPAFMMRLKNAFKGMATLFIPGLLSKYPGFESVEKLVDVGGSSGIMLAAIVAKYPHIHGINFDLPEVVAENPSLPGVEHVGGDMFKKIPSGCDAVFMKGILHDWDDLQCLKILKNCYEALPSKGGKLILVDLLISHETPLETLIPINERIGFHADMLMQVHCDNGRERTMFELEELLKQGGFINFKVVGEVDPLYIMEAFKN